MTRNDATDARMRSDEREYSRTMKAANRHLGALAYLAAGALALGGCGSSGTKTVSVSSVAPSGTTTHKTVAPSTTPSSTTTTQTSTAPPTDQQGGVEATRTTTAPAFTKQSTGTEGLSAALAVVKAHGYSAEDTSSYHSSQTLRVLVGTRTGSGDGYGQQAFFFIDGRYIGTDTSDPSASIKVVGQSDTEVALAYPLYHAHDPLCCPGGGQTTVRFQLNNGRLVPLGAIPPANSQSGLSRQ